MKNRYVVAAIASVLLLSQFAFGQSNLERFERQLEQIRREQRLKVDREVPPGQRVLVDYGGAFTYNFVSIDDFLQDTHILNQFLLNVYGRISIDNDAHEFFVRAHSQHEEWRHHDSFDGHDSDFQDFRLDRAEYKFDLRRARAAAGSDDLGWNFKFAGGRRLVTWANGLTLSEELDGGIFTVEVDPFSLDFLAATTVRDVADFDSSRPEFDDDTRRNFFGAMLKWKANDRHTPYIYGLVQDDNNDDPPFAYTVAATPYTANFKYDSYYIGFGSSGSFSDRFLYGVELVYQGGESRSRPFVAPGGAAVAQTMNTIEAYAADVKLDYLWFDANKSRFSAEFLVASGDSDRLQSSSTALGNQPNTRDSAFNAFGLVNTGMAFGAQPSNLMMLRLGYSTFPLPTSKAFRYLQVGTNVFFFSKLEDDAPIDEPTSNDYFLGSEIDVYLNWQITSDVSFTARYGVFFPGEAIGDNNLTIAATDDETDDNPRHFFYSGITLAF